MTSRRRLAGALVLLARLLVLANAGPPPLHGQDFDKAFEQTAQLIVMIDVDYGDTPEFGAGIIFGREKNRLLIATAYHVLHRGATQPARIRVKFRTMPDKPVDATMLHHGTPDELDLAVLSVDAPATHGIDVCAIPFARLGNAAGVKRRDLVSPVGNPNGTPWGAPVRPDEVTGVEGKEIVFQSAVISSGHSGGGLLDGHGNLIGMTIADQPPFGRALNMDAVITLLKQWGYPVRIFPFLEHDWTPLHFAAGKGDLAMLTTLLSDCDGVNAPDDHQATALHYAAGYSGNPEALSLLIRAGANIEAQDGDGDTPLSWAAEKGQVEAARALLKAGAKPESRNHHKQTVLHVAAEGEQYEMIKLLVAAHADVNAENGLRERPLDILHLKIGPRFLEAAKVMIAAGGKLQADSLLYDVQNAKPGEEVERQKALEALLPGVLDINAKTHTFETLLHHAVKYGNLAIVKLVVASGANVNAVAHDEYDRTPLYVAVENGKMDIAEFLLARGASVRVPGTPELELERSLWTAVEKGWGTAVKILLAAGTNPNAPEYVKYSYHPNDSNTPLKLAQKKGDQDIVNLLVRAGAK